MSARAIYLGKEYNNSKDVLFWMEHTDSRVTEDNSNYELVTEAKKVGGTHQICPRNGAMIDLYCGQNGKYYTRYDEDYSMREVSDDTEMMSLMYPNK